MKQRITCIISGRVQGVLYRDFTKRTADKLQIKGEVENLPDGTVRDEAESEEDKLAEFRSILGKGSTFSKVEGVVCESQDDLKGFEQFKIKYRSFWDRI